MRQTRSAFPLFAVALWAIVTSSVVAMTPVQRAKVIELTQKTKDAGQLYAKGEMAESAKIVAEVQKELDSLLVDRDPVLQRFARPLYTRLGRAHDLLELEGIELEALPTWEELTSERKAMAAAGAGSVSFKDDVAPILISTCGNCHVTGQRGQFSMANFAALMKGPPAGVVVFAGDSKGSRLIEVIESGDMPRGNGKVSDEQLTTLKKWIEEGAEFDGPDPTAGLATFAKGAATAAPTRMEIKKATGSETVSFAKDIAPILKENCNGCHIAGRQASGNLRMDTFAQMIRGGDSGAILSPPNATESLLIKKLKGEEGQRMPAGGRPALPTEQIELISTWIREGATYDGPAPDTNIETVVNQAWADAASHDELFQRRQERALADWKRVLPNEPPSQIVDAELFVLGNVPESRLREILSELKSAAELAKKQLDAPKNAPLIRGGLAVFVLKSRYDYSEFGRMTENRTLPRDWFGHWHADPLDVYGVVASEGSPDVPLSSVALQVITGAYLGSFSEVPAWFAEGVARNLVINNFRQDDARVKIWQQTMPAAAQQVPDAKTLLEGRLSEEAGGVVGMALVNLMMDRSNRRRFDALLNHLRDGKGFNASMFSTYGKPDLFVKQWVGK